MRDQVPEILEAVGTECPIGGHRAAERLAARTTLEVQVSDVEELVERGALPIETYYKDRPTYDVRRLDAIDVDLLAGRGS